MVRDSTLYLYLAAYTIRVRSAEYAHDPDMAQGLIQRALASNEDVMPPS